MYIRMCMTSDIILINLIINSISDGMITRDEMLQYFLRANQQLREYFKHNFAEHTFLSRATCEQCGGMVISSKTCSVSLLLNHQSMTT